MKLHIKILTFLLMSIVVGQLFASLLDISPLITVGILMFAGMIPVGERGVLMLNLGNLDWIDDTSNMGGLQTTVYYAPVVDVDNFPELPADPATPEDEVTLESVTGFTFLTTKLFLTIQASLESVQVTDEPQGEIDGQSFIHKGSLFFPGTKAEAMAFAKIVNNSRMVFVFVQPDGQRRVIGSKAFPATCKPAIDTGMKTADRKGMTLEVMSYGMTPAPFYTGTLPLTPAV